MLQEVAVYTGTSNELVKNGGFYTGNALILANKFKSALNYAKNKIAREKYAPSTSETVVLDSNLQFSITSLSKSFRFVKAIKNANGYSIFWEKSVGGKIKCPNENAGDTVTVEYSYMPYDLASLFDVLDLPEYVVDPKILCYYAAYMYFVTEGNNRDLDKSQFWLGLWNDGLESINDYIGESLTITDVYSI